MELLKTLNLGLSFLVELGAFGALAYWGFTLNTPLALRLAAGIGLPAVIIAVWGRFAAPASSTQLAMPWLAVLQMAVFTLAAALLYAAGKKQWAATLFVAAIVSEIIAIIGHQN
jgi:hypothetical protein